jgi:hypothetical protein
MVVAEAGATFYLGSEITWPSNHIGDYQFATFKRVAGAVFDMVKNADQSGGNSGIRVSNLIIDGNKSADSLVSGTVGHRFAGIFACEKSFIDDGSVLHRHFESCERNDTGF